MKRLLVGTAVLIALAAVTWKMQTQSPREIYRNSSKQSKVAPVTLEQKLALIDAPTDIDFSEASRDPASESQLTEIEKQWLQIYRSRYEDVVKLIVEKSQDPKQQEPHKILGRYLDQMARVYYRTDLKIKEFDQTLDQEDGKLNTKQPIIVERKLYKRELIPLWIIRERIRKQAIHVIISLLVVESDPSQDATVMREAAKKVLDYTRDIWKQIAEDNATGEHFEANRVMRWVLQDLYRETAHAIGRFAESYAQTFAKPVPASIAEFLELTKKIVIKDEKQLDILESQVKTTLSREIENENSKISTEAKKKQSSWISFVQAQTNERLAEESDTQRTPQSARICPSATESGGNISGSTFPKGTWALTLDDGPDVIHTETIRKAFDQNDVKGTFFWLAQLTSHSSSKTAIANVKASGHTIANHSFSHANLPTLNSTNLKKEIVTASEVHTSIYGFKPKYFRCPYGACGKSGGAIRTMIADEKMVHVRWNVDSLDWKDKNPPVLFERVKKQIKSIDAKGSGGVVLFHDIHETSASTMVLLSKWMKEQNYKVENIETIVKSLNAEQTCDNGWEP